MKKNEQIIKNKSTNVARKPKHIEDKSWQDQQELRAIMDALPIGISWADIKGNVKYNNGRFQELFGYTIEDMPDIKAWRLLAYPSPAYREQVPSLVGLLTEAQKQGKEVTPIEVTVTCKDGTIRHVLQTGVLTPNRIMAIYYDITERKLIDEKYRIILKSMEEAYFEVDLAGNFTFFNDSFCRILGYSQDEMMGMNYRKYADKENAKIIFQEYNKVYRTGKPAETKDWQMIRKDGLQIYVEESISLIKDSSGKAIGFRGIVRDITERKKAEKLLKQSEAMYRLLADHMKDQVWLLDLNLRVTYISPSLEKLLGYTLQELKKLTLDKLLTPTSFQTGMDAFSMEMDKALITPSLKRTIEVECICKDGRILWIEATLSFIMDDNGKPFSILGEGREITERKKAEEKLQRTLESLKKAVVTTIQVLVSALETRDPYTSGHQSRVADLARTIATEMELDKDIIEGIRMAGIIHDIGKLSIPAEILTKPTKLADIEFSLIKEHAYSGYEMLKNVESPWPLAEIVYQHHERMDGSGYPRKLKGDEILLEARIMAVADVVEAMASHRPYRPSLGIEVALEEIEKNKGILYDDVVSNICLKLFREKGYQFT